MKIAALYDIHGNLPALNAVLADLSSLKPDLIVIGGDIVAGPMPVQSLERLFQLDSPIKFIRGNNDREVVTAFDGEPLRSDLSNKGRERIEWVARQLSRTHRDFLASLPETFIQRFDDRQSDILFCHATPNSDEEIFTPLTSQQRLERIFQDVNERIVVCGHTHIQFERQAGAIRLINAGSIGMPYAERPGAYWLLMTPQGHEFKCTSYDLEAAANEIRASNFPQANEFVDENVLSVPTAAQAIEMLERLVKRQ